MKNLKSVGIFLVLVSAILVLFAMFLLPPRLREKPRAQRIRGVNTVVSVSFPLTNANTTAPSSLRVKPQG